jgi:hypothetical protein
MVGRFRGYETGQSPAHDGFRGELIEVSPHGKLDVKAELETLITTCDEPRWFGLAGAGLRRYKQIHAGIGDVYESELVSQDYWRRPPDRGLYLNRPPLGWYEGARGKTRVWVDCWQWTSPDVWSPPYSKTGFLKRWMSFNEGGRIEYNDGTLLGWLEISCLTWSYLDVGDYATSLFIEPVTLAGRTPYDNKHELLAQRLAQAITEKLHATLPTKESRELRLQRK